MNLSIKVTFHLENGCHTTALSNDEERIFNSGILGQKVYIHGLLRSLTQFFFNVSCCILLKYWLKVLSLKFWGIQQKGNVDVLLCQFIEWGQYVGNSFIITLCKVSYALVCVFSTHRWWYNYQCNQLMKFFDWLNKVLGEWRHWRKENTYIVCVFWVIIIVHG